MVSKKLAISRLLIFFVKKKNSFVLIANVLVFHLRLIINLLVKLFAKLKKLSIFALAFGK